jgi:hypothetical protein
MCNAPDLASEDAAWLASSVHDGAPITGPARAPCATCPWLALHAESPSRCFARPGREVVAQAWASGAQDGLLVACHVGVDERLPEHEQRFREHRVCAGALAVAHRALLAFLADEPTPIDQDAAARIALRLGFDSLDGLTPAAVLERAHPAVAHPGIVFADLAPVDGAQGGGLASWPPQAPKRPPARPDEDQSLSAGQSHALALVLTEQDPRLRMLALFDDADLYCPRKIVAVDPRTGRGYDYSRLRNGRPAPDEPGPRRWIDRPRIEQLIHEGHLLPPQLAQARLLLDQHLGVKA